MKHLAKSQLIINNTNQVNLQANKERLVVNNNNNNDDYNNNSMAYATRRFQRTLTFLKIYSDPPNFGITRT